MKTTTKLIAAAGILGSLMSYDASASLTMDGKILFNGADTGGGYNVYQSSTGPIGGKNFITFCLEQNEHFNPNGYWYDYKVNVGAVAGGVAGQTLPDDPSTGLTMDRVSLGTAFLYSQFRAGILANDSTTRAQLQQAIWWLEDETATRNSLIDWASTQLFGLTDAQLKADSMGAYGVVALNLYNGQNAQSVQAPDGTWYRVNQDMLGVVPEPSTVVAGALLLLPFGASTLRILRRNHSNVA